MENKSLGRPSTTKQCTKRDNPPCPDGGQGGGMEHDIFMLTSSAGFVRALADILEFKFGSCGDKDFSEAIIRVSAIAKGQADIIEAVAGRMAKSRGEAGNA